jgi:hypothetical protein
MASGKWKEWAKEALANGAKPGRPWERLLDRTLRRNRPELVKQLEDQGDYQSYLLVRTDRAIEMFLKLEEEGTDPHTARELALNDLLELS